MRRSIGFAAATVALLVLMLPCGGCVSSGGVPTTQPLTQKQINVQAADNLARALDDAVLATDLAYGFGTISTKDYEALGALQQQVRPLIDAVQAAANADTADFRDILQKASKSLVAYRKARDEKKQPKKPGVPMSFNFLMRGTQTHLRV